MAHEPKDLLRRYALELVVLAIVLVLILAAFAFGRSGRETIIAPAAAASTRTFDQQAQIDRLEAGRDACALARRMTVDVSAQLAEQFQHHAHAHHLWKQGKIKMGPVDEPGTVLYIWRQTLSERERLDPLLKKAIKQEGQTCV